MNWELNPGEWLVNVQKNILTILSYMRYTMD